MSPLGKFYQTGFNLRRILFRRDTERSFYSRNPFPLPKMHRVTADNLIKFKEIYPFTFAHNIDEFAACRDVFLNLTDKAEVLREASQVLEGFFSFPSKESVNLGKPVKWNTDYISGYEWSKNLSWKEDFFNFNQGTDIINAWLPARLNQLILLGKGYLASGDETFVREYISLMEDFSNENTFGTGVNWLETREVSIRLINIAFSLPFVIYSKNIDENFVNKFLEIILHHSIFIENNLNSDIQDYDLIVSIAALAVSGLVFEEIDYGKRVLYLSAGKAEVAMKRIISSEGISRAGSIPQHSQITEAFFIIRKSLRKSPVKLSATFEEKYAKLFDVLASFLRDDDTVAQIGNPFIKRILPFSRDEYKFPLTYGCYELKKGKFKTFVPHPVTDILFYFGKNAVQEYREITGENYPRISYGYRQSGIFILRNEDIHITIDAEPVVSVKRRSLGHNDILSYDLFYRGHRIISDPGMYSIYADPVVYNDLRSVKSHSTLYIDEQEPVEFEGLFSVKEDLTNPKVTEWHSDEYEDILSVQHYAYARFSDPVIIKRIFRLLKEKNKLIIRDELFGGSTHQAVSNIILHPEVFVKQTENFFQIYSPVSGEILISSPVSVLTSSVRENSFSDSYGRLTTTKKISTGFTASFPVYLTTEIQLK